MFLTNLRHSEYSKCSPVVQMQTWIPAPLVGDIINNALFHSGSHINQMMPRIIHILYFCLVDSLLYYAPLFLVNLDWG